MSSRQEEKERRRQERLAAEQEAARRQASRERLQWVGGGLLAVIAVAVLVAFVIVPAVGGGGGDDSGGDGGPKTAATGNTPPIPPQVDTNLQSSVKSAGCTVQTFPSAGREHSANPADWKFKTNPPTSGTHDPTAATDGVYPFGKMPSVGQITHALEHGRIGIQYGPQVTEKQYAQLETLLGETDNFHQLLFRNQTKMPFAVAATAWTQLLGCKTFNPKVFDAMRNFRERYTDLAPESVP